MMEKIYESLREVKTKGSLFEQAKRLCKQERELKRLISLGMKDEVLWKRLQVDELEKELYDLRMDMVALADRVKDTIGILEENLDIEVLVEHFGLDYEEYDEEEDFYINLVSSATPIGHVIRMALIHSEKLVKDRYR